MRKLLIVDDETPIREWLAFVIQRSGYPCRIVGLAANGREALELVRAERPDTVITDIRMPVMDGLEFIRQLRSETVGLNVVVLTSYDDFEYARTSVKQGVCDYILKTEINEGLIIEVLERLDRQERLDRLDDADADNREQLTINRNLYINQLLFASTDNSLPITQEELERRGIPLRDSALFAVAIRFELLPIPKRFDPFPATRILHQRRIADPVWFAHGLDTLLVVANVAEGLGPQLARKTVDEFVAHLARDQKVSIGVSRVRQGVSELRKAVNAALVCLSYRYYDGPGGIHHEREDCGRENRGRDDAHRDDARRDDDSRPQDHDCEGAADETGGQTIEAHLQAIRRSLGDAGPGTSSHSGTGSTSNAVENLIRFLGQQRPLDMAVFQTRCASLFDGYFQASGREADRPLAHNLEAATSFASFSSLLRDTAATLGPGAARQAYSHAVEKALLYIRTADLRTMNLAAVAGHVGLNPEYFSRLFKEETGHTFINYLTELRVNHAQHLLRTSNLKVYEVAEVVGYGNLSYFSKVFKRQTGFNPFEFKQRPGPANGV
jgi:two-component system response regulator YesN